MGLVSVSTSENLDVTHFHHENFVIQMYGASGNLTHFAFLFFFLFICSFVHLMKLYHVQRFIARNANWQWLWKN